MRRAENAHSSSAGRVRRDVQVDLRGAPLKAKMKGFQRNTAGLMEYLKYRDDKHKIKVKESALVQGVFFIRGMPSANTGGRSCFLTASLG